MHYLLMSEEKTYPWVVLRTPLKDLTWFHGERFKVDPPPLRFEVEAVTGFTWPDYIKPNCIVPLFSPRMKDAIDSLVWEHVDYYAATVVDLATGEERPYHAANIFRLIPAMDHDASVFTRYEGDGVAVRDIDRLVIDETKTGRPPIFRLAEFRLCVLVCDTVKTALEQARLVGVRLLLPPEWDGFAC